MNVAGDFQIVISNQNYAGNDSSTGTIVNDQIDILAITWTGYTE